MTDVGESRIGRIQTVASQFSHSHITHTSTLIQDLVKPESQRKKTSILFIFFRQYTQYYSMPIIKYYIVVVMP